MASRVNYFDKSKAAISSYPTIPQKAQRGFLKCVLAFEEASFSVVFFVVYPPFFVTLLRGFRLVRDARSLLQFRAELGYSPLFR